VPMASASTLVILDIDPRNLEFEAPVKVPLVDRRRNDASDRRGDPQSGGRRRTDATDADQ